MVRFHVSPRDGVARRCNAGSGPNARGCRYGLGDNDHYATKAEANQAAEQSNKKVNGGTFNKKTKVKNDVIEDYSKYAGIPTSKGQSWYVDGTLGNGVYFDEKVEKDYLLIGSEISQVKGKISLINEKIDKMSVTLSGGNDDVLTQDMSLLLRKKVDSLKNIRSKNVRRLRFLNKKKTVFKNDFGDGFDKAPYNLSDDDLPNVSGVYFDVGSFRRLENYNNSFSERLNNNVFVDDSGPVGVYDSFSVRDVDSVNKFADSFDVLDDPSGSYNYIHSTPVKRIVLDSMLNDNKDLGKTLVSLSSSYSTSIYSNSTKSVFADSVKKIDDVSVVSERFVPVKSNSDKVFEMKQYYSGLDDDGRKEFVYNNADLVVSALLRKNNFSYELNSNFYVD